MGKISEIIQGFGERGKERKELLKGALEQHKIEKIVQERDMSANERELLRDMEEDRQKEIKKQLDISRKKRSNEINFEHNILKTPNITKGSDFDILKTKNIFPNKNMLKQRRVI